MIEGLILLLVGIGAMGAFVVGVALLIMWYRAGQVEDRHREPVVYGNMVQCPRCEWMNPLDTAVCLKCRAPLNVPHGFYPAEPLPTLPPTPATQFPAYIPPAGATARSPFAPPAPQPGMSDGTVRAPSTPAQAPAQTVITQRDPASGAAPDSAAGEAWLDVTAGIMKGQRLPLSQSDTLFGRSTKCDVQISDPKISRKHFVVRYAQGGYFLQDQGSTSGTLINGEPVEARRLMNGDRIDLGDTTLVFRES